MHYQEEGSLFLASGKVRILADEMGLGKTKQLIDACDYVGATKILVVTPAISKTNWQREFEMWSMSGIRLDKVVKLTDCPSVRMTCSFEYATKNYQILKDIGFDVLIADEFHFLKSPTARRTLCILGNDGIAHTVKHTWLSSGTPAPNNVSEFWIPLRLSGVCKLSLEDFVKKHCNGYFGKRGFKITGNKRKAEGELREMLSKIMIRRTAMDVGLTLPSLKIETVPIKGGLDTTEVKDLLKDLCSEDRLEDLAERLVNEEFLVKSVIEKHGTEDKGIKKLLEISESLSTIRRITALQKVEEIASIIKHELQNSIIDSVVIFCWHVEVMKFLFKKLENYKPLMIYGAVPEKVRQNRIDKFQLGRSDESHNNFPVIICQIKAAGTAINLTRSNQVVFVEQSFVPGDNAQAVKRIHRRGQTRPCHARIFTLKESIDEAIEKTLARKTYELTRILEKEET